MAALENPANTPISARHPKNCQTLPEAPISAVNSPIARLERISINLRPCRSATCPQIGEAKAATSEVMPLRTPAQMSIAASLSTPSTGRNSGMIGVSIENAPVITNWMPTIAHSVCRHCAASPPASVLRDCTGAKRPSRRTPAGRSSG